MLTLLLLLACDPAPEDIARAVGSENPVMREDGAKIAQNYDDPVVIEALVKVLSDPSEKVRLNAIESLAELDATAAVPALIDSLNGDPSPKVKRAAVDALGRLVAKESVPDIIAYVEGFSADDREQLAGVWALGWIGSKGLDPELKKSALNTLVARREKSTDKFIVYQANAALRTLR
jgi:HEAT repeat protein